MVNGVCAIVSGVLAVGLILAGSPPQMIYWNAGACAINALIYFTTRKR